MDWNGKWDWENLVMFNPNAIDCPRRNQADWGGVEDEAAATSFGGGLCSGSEMGYGSSSARSSTISVSADSTSKINGINVSKPTIVHLSQTEQSGGEPVIGLKLGKRIYFENSSTGSNNAAKNASISATNPVSSVLSPKKIKPCSQRVPSPRCQVEGCNLDLSSAKEYHRKHRVCDAHSKCQKVVVAGLDRRFCQQCSRFHSLSEFDEKKRSCRRRLSDHNARRRKPHQEAIQFSSTRVLAPVLEGGHQISFLLNSTPVLEGRSFEIPLWESSTCSSSSKFMLTKQYPWKSELPFCQGLKKSMPSSSSSTSELVLAQDNNNSNSSHRALSLLSNNNSCPPQPKQAAKFPFDYPQPLSFPMAAHQYWGEPAHDSAAAVLDHGAQFQEIQLLKQQPSYYTADIYSNLLNK